MGGVCGVLAALELAALFAVTGCASRQAESPGQRAISPIVASHSAVPTNAVPSGRSPIVSGPLSAVDGWIEGLNTASTTAALEPLRAWALPMCPCLVGAASSLLALSAQHQHLDVDYRLASATLIARQGMSADMTVALTWGAYDVLTTADVAVHTESGGEQTSRFSLREVGNRWLVAVIS